MSTSKDIIDSIKIIAEDKVNNAPFDRTYTGLISKINKDGSYDVIVNREVYTMPLYIKRNLVLNQTVRVTFPLNNVSNGFII